MPKSDGERARPIFAVGVGCGSGTAGDENEGWRAKSAPVWPNAWCVVFGSDSNEPTAEACTGAGSGDDVGPVGAQIDRAATGGLGFVDE